MKEGKLRIGLLISGGGSTAEAVIKACSEGRIFGIEPAVVISSRPDASGIQKVQALRVKTLVVQPRGYRTTEAFGEQLLSTLKMASVDLVSQNGWLVKTPSNVIGEYEGRIINQHPGPLDPGRIDFGGQGMYGTRVICAQLAYQWITREKTPWTESTIHYVSEEYDQGNLIRVIRMETLSPPRSVTVDELGKEPQNLIEATRRVQAQLLPFEHRNIIAVLQCFAEGQVPKFERFQPLIPKGNEFIVGQAKQLATQLFPRG